jgi:S1-C subfamily serine protease
MPRSIALVAAIVLGLAGCATGRPTGGGVRPLSTGSGVAIHPDGYVLTAHHVVDGPYDLVVLFADGRQATATVESQRPEVDLALLKLSIPTPEHLPIADPASIFLGQRVYTIGYPAVSVLGTQPKYTDGTISDVTGMTELPGSLQISVPIQPGSSGGPLVNEAGELVGVVLSSADEEYFLRQTGTLPQNVSWAIRVDPAPDMLEMAPPPAPPRTRRESIARTVAASCLIVAWPRDG